jgi:hypothetical protein
MAVAAVAGIGLTSTAAFVVPGVLLAVSAASGSWGRVVPALATGVYPVAVAAVGTIGGGVAAAPVHLAAGAGIVVGQVAGVPTTLRPEALWYFVFGTGVGHAVAFGAVLFGWLTVRDRVSRTALVVAPLLVFVAFLTPGAPRVLDQFGSAGSVLWRGAWIVPVPAVVGLVLTAPLTWGARRALAVGAPVVALAALLAFETPVVSADNRGVWLGRPTSKVDRDARRVADHLVALSRPGEVIAAPGRDAAVIAILHAGYHPVNPRDAALSGPNRTPGFERQARLALTAAVTDGSGADAAPKVARALDTLDVDTVCTRTGVEPTWVGTMLTGAGFNVVERDDQCAYWRRPTRP